MESKKPKKKSDAMKWHLLVLYASSLGSWLHTCSLSSKVGDTSALDRSAELASEARDEARKARAAATEAQSTADDAKSIATDTALKLRRSSSINDYDRVKLRDCETDYYGERTCKLVK